MGFCTSVMPVTHGTLVKYDTHSLPEGNRTEIYISQIEERKSSQPLKYLMLKQLGQNILNCRF